LERFTAGAETTAVWSEIQLTDLDLSDRFDAEYYQPAFLATATALRGGGRKLGELGSVTCSAFYPAATQLYDIGDVPFIRCVDVVSFPVITGDQPFEKVPREFVKTENGVKTLGTDDIVITKVGTPCYAGIIHESLEYCALTRTVLGVQDLKQGLVDPYYLVAFLRSKYGFYQLMRERERQIQLQLTLERVRRINVFLPPLEVQRSIGDIVRDHHRQIERSKKLYAEAKALLLSELGVDDLDLSHQRTYTQNASQAWEAGRLDPEYFQPKYTRVERTLRSGRFPCCSLGELIAPIMNGFDYRDYVDAGTPYIRVGDVSNGRIDLEGAEKVGITIEDVSKDVDLRPGDIVFTRKGTFGRTAVVREGQEHAIISSEIMRLRLKDPRVKPDYLALFLNSIAGYQQIEQRVHGVAFFSISQDDLASITVSIPSNDVQERVAQLVVQSIEAENEAKHLLEQAKRRVEEMVLGGE
jgi:type I restriction enzyme M protein